MEERKKVMLVSQVMGILINQHLSAKEAIEILELSEQTYLERSYHVSANKKDGSLSDKPSIEIKGLAIDLPTHDIQLKPTKNE